MAEGGNEFGYDDPNLDHAIDNDDDDDDDETQPLLQNKTGSFTTSTPAYKYQTHVQEEMEMGTFKKDGEAEKSYTETSFGAPKSSERAWNATKDLFPNMSSSDLEVSYNTKGKLQVKMFGAGKKAYNLMTTDKKTGQEKINKSLPKEIQKALGLTKYGIQREDFKKLMDKKTQEIKEENNKLEREENNSLIVKSRAKIRVLQLKKISLKEQMILADMRDSSASKEAIEKQQTQVRKTDSNYIIDLGAYNNKYPTEKIITETFYDEVPDDEDPEVINQRQMVLTIVKQNDALRSRIVSDKYTLRSQKETAEEREEVQKRLETNQATYYKNEEEKNELLEELGISDSVLEQERLVLQKEKDQLDVLIEKDKKFVDDINLSASEREEAETRIEQHEAEREWVSERLAQTERQSLREKVKEIFKKYGVTVTAIFLAAGVTIAAVLGTITNALKKLGKGLANGLKAVAKKAASALPGLIGAIVSFLFRAAASAIGFLAEHTWLLILAVVAFLFQKLMKKD